MLNPPSVRILQANFHPTSRAKPGPGVLVARIYFDDRCVSVAPAQSVFDTSAPLEKLRYLVAHARSDPYEALLSLRSDYWSFEAEGRG